MVFGAHFRLSGYNDAITANRSNASSVAAASEAWPSSGAHQPDPPQIGRPESDDSAAQHISAEAGPIWDGNLEAPMHVHVHCCRLFHGWSL